MPKNLQKSLQDCLSKIKKQTLHLQFSHSSFSSTTSKIFSGCKHPKSLSFAINRKESKGHDDDQHGHDEAAAATLEDIDRFLVENFKSLYGQDDEDGPTKEGVEEESRKNNGTSITGAVPFDSPKFFTPPHPNLCGSHRFFVSPASSGSLLEEAGTSTSEDENGTRHPRGLDDCIAILRVSPSPHEDFRRSMKEMVEARVNHNQSVDWDFMEELLFCYLRLNEKKQYKYVLNAFVDLIVTLRQNSSNRGLR